MIRLPFIGRKPDLVAALYADLVSAARAEAAYRDYGVVDSFEGRFERLVLVATLMLRRLRQLPPPAEARAQELVDKLFDGLDDGLRRAGIGDLSVGKKVKKLAQGFYGRAEAYTAALEAGDETALREALSRNLYGGAVAPEAILPGVLGEIRDLEARLAEAGLAELLAGGVLNPQYSQA